MAAKLTQDHRIGAFNTPLGKDVLVLVRLDAVEGLSQLFEFRIEALSEKPDLNFDGAIGQQCTLKIKTYGEEREFNGIMVEAQWVGVKDKYYSYRVVLRPWFWLLTRTTDCRIFQDKRAPEIIKQVFQDRGFTDFESKLTDEGSYPELEYCVQYRETDFNFISRLMEKEGIYYFFKHEDGKHKLVMADSKSSHKPVKKREETPYLPNIGQFHRKVEHLYEWISERRFETGKIELNDYNYETPNAKMLSDAKGSERYTRSDMEVYDYPGNYKKKSIGERYAKIQLESEQARDHHRHANGDSMSLFAGGLTTLKEHPQSSQNIQYLIVHAAHTFMAEAYTTGAASAGGSPYYGSYELMPSDRPFRAPIVTPKPLIHGIQTALVVTKDQESKEEIDVEKLTEIYVRFYWDRKNKRSCKLRCAQVWSGKKWGGQFIPRVGQEAVIEFLEGDPDRPLVVGTVYNDNNKPPYDLPEDKTIAGIKSQSSKDKPTGYNEWHFEDKKGSEKITVHAEKDLDTVILHAETRTIGEKFETPTGMPSRKTDIKKGDDKLKLDTGSRNIDVAMMYTLKAGVMIKLECGASKITMTPASIMIEAPLISLNGALIKIN